MSPSGLLRGPFVGSLHSAHSANPNNNNWLNHRPVMRSHAMRPSGPLDLALTERASVLKQPRDERMTYGHVLAEPRLQAKLQNSEGASGQIDPDLNSALGLGVAGGRILDLDMFHGFGPFQDLRDTKIQGDYGALVVSLEGELCVAEPLLSSPLT